MTPIAGTIDAVRIADILSRAVMDYLRDDQRASYPLTGDVWMVARSKRAWKKIKDGFERYTTADGAISLYKLPDGVIKAVAHQFPRSKNLWNGPDLLRNNKLASMFASLFHDLIWGHRRELAEALGISVPNVLRIGNDLFIQAWRAIDGSFKGKVESWIAFQAVSAAAPWYHKLKGSALALVALGLLSGCYSVPEGEVLEVGGVEVVEQIMKEYGDGLQPAAQDEDDSK